MAEIGYALSSEEHPPMDLVDYAERAEDVGFEFASISDHYHPWTSQQGNSPFVWSVLGAIAERTDDLRVGTGVTCPIERIHPAVVAQAAATTAAMRPDRFYLGLGTGENLNEHVTGAKWPPHPVRLEMLAEATDVIRRLWSGENVNHRGEHFTVENARLFTLPETPPPIYVAASGVETATSVGAWADGLVSTAPKEELVSAFADASDDDPARYGQVTVCWAEREAAARETAHEWWPNTALPGELAQDLPTPVHFEQAAQLVTADDVAETVVCGPDADRHIDGIQTFVDAGFDHVYVHQVGPDQRGFFSFYEEEVLPSFS